jgi:predicted RNase H-like HicB family nuclease
MDHPAFSFTAVYLKAKHGYVGFVEEFPDLNSHGQTIEEARANLKSLAIEIFDLERTHAQELLKGKDVVREGFTVSVAPADEAVTRL